MAVKQSTSKEEVSEALSFEKHKEEIKNSAADAVQLITAAAATAAKVVSEAAAVSVKVLHDKNADDHDLLIELKTAMGFLRNDIRDLSTGVTQKIAALESSKADKKDLEALALEVHGPRETRVRSVEDKIGSFLVYIILLSVATGGLFTFLIMHVLKQ
jgi:predicted DsbA family dithiol-disulfide isomerase